MSPGWRSPDAGRAARRRGAGAADVERAAAGHRVLAGGAAAARLRRRPEPGGCLPMASDDTRRHRPAGRAANAEAGRAGAGAEPGTVPAVPSETPPRVVAVAGGKGGVGKSLVAANVGIFLATIGKRVVIVDAALGTPNLHVFAGVQRPSRTLSECLVPGGPRLDELTIATPVPALRLVAGVGDPSVDCAAAPDDDPPARRPAARAVGRLGRGRPRARHGVVGARPVPRGRHRHRRRQPGPDLGRADAPVRPGRVHPAPAPARPRRAGPPAAGRDARPTRAG